MASDAKLKVLYIAGNGRSGSTLFDVILGQVPGFFAVGEVRNVWDYGLVENRPCGCGAPVRECEIWGKVFRSFPEDRSFDPAIVAEWRERFAQTKHLVPIFLRGRRYAEAEDKKDYLRVTEQLYQAIARTTGARVVVDSSKWPAYAYLLDSIPSLDVHVLHLVRDPRACAFSWRRRQQAEPGKYLDLQGPVYSTSYWTVWNPAIHRLFGKRDQRYLFMRYEDFVAAPRRHIDAVLRFVGEDTASAPFASEDTVAVAGTHAIEGNVAKFARGELRIRADHEWRTKMGWGSRAVVTAMTWPMLWRYGYLGR